jgi:hypothetical protein
VLGFGGRGRGRRRFPALGSAATEGAAVQPHHLVGMRFMMTATDKIDDDHGKNMQPSNDEQVSSESAVRAHEFSR